LLLDQLEEGTRRRQRLDVLARGGNDVDGAIGTHRQAVAQVRLGIGGRDRGDDHLGGDALVAQAQGLFQRDLVERVGRQLDAIGDHAGTIRLDLDADVVVHHALVSYEDVHRTGPVKHGRWRPEVAHSSRGDLWSGAGGNCDWRSGLTIAKQAVWTS